MINAVSSNMNYAAPQKAQNKGVKPDLACKNVPFGYGDYQQQDGLFDKIKDGFASLTSGIAGLVGFNLVLWWLQEKVNGNILIGKINKHYTDKIHDDATLTHLAGKMLEENGLDKTVSKEFGQDGEAYYTAAKNSVVIGKDKCSALFHEIGHAIIENKKPILKFLQDHRGNYTPIALGLYALMSQNRQQSYDPYNQQHESLGTKIKNFFTRSTLLVPLLAFSPELITEAMASKYGMDFLKEQVKLKKITPELRHNIGKSYLACFGTYLFIPVSIILMEILQNSIEKEVQKHRYNKMVNSFMDL